MNIRATALLCTLLFAVGLFAQYPATQPNQSQTGTSQAPQTAQPPQTTPPSQNMPSSPSNQSMQAPSQGQAHGSSVDDQVKILSTELNLTPDQQDKVRTILTDQHQQAMTVVQDNAMSRDDKLNKIHSLRETTISRVRQILTAQQQPKFDEMIANMRQRQEGGAPPSGATSPGNNTPASTPPGATPPTSQPPAGMPPGGRPPQ